MSEVGTPGILSDDALWRAFHDATLPAAAWTHAAHLRIAWLHLERHELDEAHLRMRVGIIRLNAAHGLVETAQRGYHETLTWVWLVLVAAARRRAPAADSTIERGLSRPLSPGEAGRFTPPRVASRDSIIVLGQPGLEREAPLAYYSRARLFSVAARARFVPPDLAELPGA